MKRGAAARGTVTVIGEMLVDQFDSGPVIGGAPFNVARHLAAFGHAPLMISAIGADADGRLLAAELERFAMLNDGIQTTPGYATGVVEVHMADDGSHRFFIQPGCAWEQIELAPAQAAITVAHRCGWLYAGTLALRAPTSCATQLALLQSHSGPCCLDINWREGHVAPEVAMQAIALADVLKVNEAELAMLGGWYGCSALAGAMADAVAETARDLFGRLTLDLLLVTLGPGGAIAVDARDSTRCAAQRPVHLVDTVGAGDAFSAVALTGFLRGWDLPSTLNRAVEFAGRICEMRGAVPPQLASYRAWTADWPG